jgi:tetratricopeptide (TPR) repeat protein
LKAFGPLVVLLLTLVHAIGPASAQSATAPPAKLSARDAALVEQRLADAARRNPQSFDAQYALASFYLRQGRLDRAIPHLERAQSIDPGHYASGYDLALALIETGRVAPARDLVIRMLAAKETGELRNLLGDLEERAGNLVAAAEAYQRAAHMEATEEHLFDWGNNLIQLKALEPAEQVFDVAVERFPKSARLHVGRGIAQYARGRYPEAVRSFCAASDLAPLDPRPHQFLGEMYGVAPELGAEVTRRLARFVKGQPRNAPAHFHYAMSLWKGQPTGAPPPDLAEVERLLRRAARLDPALANARLQLGILLSDQQRYPEAIQELRRATEQDPSLAQAHYRLAQAYQRTNQPELAARELEIFETLKGKDR